MDGMTRTIVVIGGTGFAGRHFVAAADGADLGVTTASRRRGEADLVCDLLDPASIDAALTSSSPDAVVNLVGAASVALSLRDPATTFRVNVLGTLNLLEACTRLVPRAHLLCISSGEVYGSVPESELPATEQREPKPVNPYATSKASMELVCEQYRGTTELRIAVVRAFNHTGPGQSDVFAASNFARQIAEAERDGRASVKLRTGNLDVERDFSDVRDIVRAYMMVVEQGLTGTFNACSGKPTRLRQLVDHLAAATHLPVEISVESNRMRPGEPPIMYGSAERLRESTGWIPEIPLGKTAGDLLEWWRKRMSK
jgi:GDP-4-dehydro-6-deoxy-D-mannose reductase